MAKLPGVWMETRLLLTLFCNESSAFWFPEAGTLSARTEDDQSPAGTERRAIAGKVCFRNRWWSSLPSRTKEARWYKHPPRRLAAMDSCFGLAGPQWFKTILRLLCLMLTKMIAPLETKMNNSEKWKSCWICNSNFFVFQWLVDKIKEARS